MVLTGADRLSGPSAGRQRTKHWVSSFIAFGPIQRVATGSPPCQWGTPQS